MLSFADNSTKLIVLLEKYWFFCFKLEYNYYICATFKYKWQL